LHQLTIPQNGGLRFAHPLYGLGGPVASMALCWLNNGSADHLAEPASRHRVKQFGYFALLHQTRQAFGITLAGRLVG
jgi:hypothetical protein